MFTRVLVAFDGSPPARKALEFATEVAARFHSALVVGFVPPAGPTEHDSVLASLVPLPDGNKAFGAVIEEVRAHALPRGVASVESLVLQGEVVDALVDSVKRHHIDLLVVGSRGLSRGQRLLLGSVSSALVQQAPCPVLVVRGVR